MNRRRFIHHAGSSALLAALAPVPLLSAEHRLMEHPSTEKSLPRICFFSKHLQWLDYGEMAVLVRNIGFTGIDLTVREGGHVLPEQVRQDLPLAVRKIRDEGLEVPMITTGITDPEDPVTWQVLETAGKLGIPLYRPGWFQYREGEAVTGQLKHAADQLAKLQRINRDNQIAASYQNHAGSYIGSSGWDLLRIIEGLDPQWTGVQFDIRHAMVEGPESWPYILELLAPYINSLDIKDFTWGGSGGISPVNVPLGQGLVPFEEYFGMLNRLGIEADMSLHLEYPLGGAEHGSSTLNIPVEEFTGRVRADLNYLKSMLS
ncbi:MAG: sugar phosphate isomerase/epimerase family protein [Bacteroidales bacterium]